MTGHYQLVLRQPIPAISPDVEYRESNFFFEASSDEEAVGIARAHLRDGGVKVARTRIPCQAYVLYRQVPLPTKLYVPGMDDRLRARLPQSSNKAEQPTGSIPLSLPNPRGKLVLYVSAERPSEADQLAEQEVKAFDPTVTIDLVKASTGISTPRLAFGTSSFRGLGSIRAFIEEEKLRDDVQHA